MMKSEAHRDMLLIKSNVIFIHTILIIEEGKNTDDSIKQLNVGYIIV